VEHTPRFDLVDLRLFAMVAEVNSLTRAAERSFLSLAAVSLRIKSLEEALGTKLLYRAQRGVSLTVAGEVFAERARTILHEIDRLNVDMRPFSKGIRGHVRLFANTPAVTELLPSVLAQFFRVHGDISVDLQERLSPEIVRAVHDGLADIGVISSNVRADGLETLPYMQDRLVLAVPEGHPLAGAKSIGFSETLEYDFIGLDTNSATHTFLQHEMLRIGLAMRIRIRVRSFDAIFRMIEADLGIGVIPEIVARRHAKVHRVKIVQLQDEWAVREFRICMRRASELPVFVRELVDFILRS